MIADAFDGDHQITQNWLEHDVSAEPYDSRYPNYSHTHQGVDIEMPIGTGIYAVDSGVVGMVAYATLQLHLDSGHDIWIFHISQSLVLSGQRFIKNQKVALSGNTVPGGGASTGPHLHYEVRPAGVPYNPTNNSLDPIPFLKFVSAPAPLAPGEFSCVMLDDAWTHSTPDIKVTSRVDLVDKGATVVFNAWTHAGPEVGAVPDLISGATGDDRMFRSKVRGLWIASSVVLGVPGNGAPEIKTWVPEPIPNPTPVPFTGDPKIMEGKWIWEWDTQADYLHLKELGFDGVLIRAYNGESGVTAESQLAQFKIRAPHAVAAGLKVVPWTYWYGPGEPGYTENDPAAYLIRCAKATVGLKLDYPGWVIDAEAHSMSGLAPALKYLRDQSGKAVFLAPPGDPKEFGFIVDWPALDSVVDGYIPQMYTMAWGMIPTYLSALTEWNNSKPLYPANDEQDPSKIALLLVDVKTHSKGWSYWRSGVGTEDTLKAYTQTIVPTPNPDQNIIMIFLRQLYDVLKRLFGG